MTNYLNTRNANRKFTNAEFDAIPRNNRGDLADVYDAYSFITTAQRDELTEDDWSRMLDLDEEVGCMMADARAEFADQMAA